MGIISKEAKNRFGGDKYRLLTAIFSREGLREDLRSLCSIAFLQAESDRENLTRFLEIFVTDHVRLRSAYEILLQGYLFCGYPKAIESFFCLNDAVSGKQGLAPGEFQPRLLGSSDELIRRGEDLSKTIHRDKFEKMRDRISGLCPDLGYLMIAEGYGHVLSRDGLDLKSRELAVVSTLTSLETHRQLHSHIRGARNIGCGDDEIYEAIVTGIAWSPSSKIESAVGLWKEITGRDTPEKIDIIDPGRV